MNDREIWQKLCAEVKPLAKKYREQEAEKARGEDDSGVKQSHQNTISEQEKESLQAIGRKDVQHLQQKIQRGLVSTEPKNIYRPILHTPKAFTALDGKSAQRFRTGKVSIEATLDLHGQTERQASQSFSRFFLKARKQHLRCVLIITGRGSGVLQQGLAKWLDSPEISPYLIGVTPMPQHKGGDGAYALYLRKN